MMNIIPFSSLFLSCCVSTAQPHTYTVANAHAHNDYENAIPFYMAYGEGFGSIEADIFLENGELIVAHDTKEVLLHRTLQEYYLQPLLAAVRRNNGFPYGDSSRQLQMLIDIKTDAVPTLNALIAALSGYPPLVDNPRLKWVITGNRPERKSFVTYPGFIWFDGELSVEYGKDVLIKIALFSDNFKNYANWNGEHYIPDIEKMKLRKGIDKAHQVNKPVRYWNAPDTLNAWHQLMRLGVDYINTDHVTALSFFLNGLTINQH
jgi:alkaline phosphatase